jgi:hypothetical protein
VSRSANLLLVGWMCYAPMSSLALRIHSPNFPACCATLGMEQPPTSRIAWRGSSAGSSVLDAKHIPPTSMAAISGWSTHRLSIGTRSADTLVRSSEELTRHTYQLPDRPRRSGSFLCLVSLTLRRAGRSARAPFLLHRSADTLVRSSEELVWKNYRLPDRPRRSGSFLYLVSLTLRRAGRSARNTLNLKNDSDFLEYLRF